MSKQIFNFDVLDELRNCFYMSMARAAERGDGVTTPRVPPLDFLPVRGYFGIHRTLCSSAKRENISSLSQLLRVLTRINCTTHDEFYSRISTPTPEHRYTSSGQTVSEDQIRRQFRRLGVDALAQFDRVLSNNRKSVSLFGSVCLWLFFSQVTETV